jgi:hypothetical protein
VSASGKGIVGGALLGGEVGFLGLAAAGSKTPYLYYTIPPALAVAGGIGGYFIEHNASNAHVPMYMLAGGMALIIPTVVITLSATHYTPTSEDATPVDATPAPAPGGATGTVDIKAGGSGSSGTTAPAPTKRKPEASSLRTPSMPIALLNVANDTTTTVSLGLPMVSMRPMYTRTEVALYGVQQKYEFHAPVVALAF